MQQWVPAIEISDDDIEGEMLAMAYRGDGVCSCCGKPKPYEKARAEAVENIKRARWREAFQRSLSDKGSAE